MGRGWKHWAGVAAASVFGFAWIALQPDVYPKHQQVLEQQFHLPTDVEYVLLESDKAGKHSRENIRAIVQFTPGQYNNYVRSLHDTALWSSQPFVWRGVHVDASGSKRAMTWWDDNDAFHDGSTFPSYLHWGHNQDEVWDVTPSYSFCFAVLGEDSQQEIRQCGDVQDRRPELYVRGLIDPDAQRLYAYIATS